MEGEDVLELQEFLNNNGFILASSGNGSPGNETNYFGVLTYNALVRFQEVHAEEILAPWGISRGTGIFGKTSRALANMLAK